MGFAIFSLIVMSGRYTVAQMRNADVVGDLEEVVSGVVDESAAGPGHAGNPRRELRESLPEDRGIEDCVNAAERAFTTVQETAEAVFTASTLEPSRTRQAEKASAETVLKEALEAAGDNAAARAQAYETYKQAILRADAEFDAATTEPRSVRDASVEPARVVRTQAIEACQHPASSPTPEPTTQIDSPVEDVAPTPTPSEAESASVL